MINHISIKDFAIIKDLDVDFGLGLNVLTGETGSGKSVIFEGISLALGARADSSFIRTGAPKAVVQLTGELGGEDIVIYRDVSSTGKNLCKLNGEIITLSELNKVCSKLADIHGQYDNQSLLNPDNHIEFLDNYARANLQEAKEDTALAYDNFKEVYSKLKMLLDREKESKEKLDFYKFQLDEIDKLNLKEGEDVELENQIKLLENSEKIYKNAEGAYEKVYSDGDSALTTLFDAMKGLEEIASCSKEIQDVKDRFAEAYYNLEDLGTDIRNIKDSITFSQEALDSAIARYEAIKGAKEKYGGTIKDVLSYRDKINQIIGSDIDIAHEKQELNQQCAKLKETLIEQATTLSNLRKIAAKKLKLQLEKELSELNFTNCKIETKIEKASGISRNGFDVIEFLISPNQGEAPKPLAKIASGGEMSRIMLAFKKIINDNDNVPTLFFDEIDSGISGITASIVGKKLKEISKSHQIICITHLAQIAAYGDRNYKIEKIEDNNSTITTVRLLSPDEKIQEIARLIGGTNITDTTLKSAKELIDSSK